MTSGANRYICQFIVQQLGVDQFSTYRVVIYGDQVLPRHADFLSAQELLLRLGEAIPEIDWSAVSTNPMGEGRGSIAFDQQLKLDTAQLRILGF